MLKLSQQNKTKQKNQPPKPSPDSYKPGKCDTEAQECDRK